ncbi:uncharacterized protein LOC125203145 [Salvia hispanica]|uniref:uncharacterized protein LOC125203145 n=1 Tax=Salvia hispanica TaxID=49212 RepID=UPI002009198D|nr:uncharacterized protein LOC125203145 [Salvia hispanica]
MCTSVACYHHPLSFKAFRKPVNMTPPNQASYLYHGVWSAATDSIVLDTMLTMKKETRWTGNNFPSWFLMTAAQELQTRMGIVVTEEELAKRMVIMHRRYRVFKAVVRTFGAQWDQDNKIITASDELWEKIMKYDWFVGAYYHHDEPEWTKLACLFGLGDVKVEHEVEGQRQNEVVIISDDTVKVPTGEPYINDTNEVNEEVNSPAIPHPLPVRRKLFDDPPPTDNESTTDKRICFIDLALDGSLRTRFEKTRSLPQSHAMKAACPGGGLGEAGPSSKSTRASSCASNSPRSWYPHNIRRP